MNTPYVKPCVAASVTEAVVRSVSREQIDPDADHDLPVVAAIAGVVAAGVEVYTVVTSVEAA